LSVADNLLNNAIKHGEQGGRIVFRLAARSDGFDELSIWNSGPGVPADERERIFECFETGDHHLVKQGSGIGLHLARRIAEAHHGYLKCESEFGAWARFSCLLPQHEVKPSDVSVTQPGRPAGSRLTESL
jgi:two-component system sensor histidine kinase KdpD